jgi:hypothetical protein
MLVVVSGAARPAMGDVVFLKNGQRIEGTIADKGSLYELKTEHGSVELPKSDVDRLVRSPEAITREVEETRFRARVLCEEVGRLEGNVKAANAKNCLETMCLKGR